MEDLLLLTKRLGRAKARLNRKRWTLIFACGLEIQGNDLMDCVEKAKQVVVP